jgi:hypothetical protein
VRDVWNFESNFGLSIIYVERDTLFGEFWKIFSIFFENLLRG